MKDSAKLARTYANIIDRCENPANHAYIDYGGRGITVCDEWLESPIAFFRWCEDQHIDTGGLQLDRTDNSKGYSPDNCKFVTPKENMRNRRTTLRATAWGETKTLVEWSEDHRAASEIQYKTIWSRIGRGWTAEKAISKPVVVSVHKLMGRPPAPTVKGSHPQDPTIEAFGETKALWEWAQDARCRVGKKVLWKRINELGWTSEDAITKHPSPNNGIRYEGQTILYWSKQPGCEVSYNTLSRRLKDGQKLERAMKQQVVPRGRHLGNKYATIDKTKGD